MSTTFSQRVLTLHEAIHSARDKGHSAAVVCLSPMGQPYCIGDMAYRIRWPFNTTLTRFCRCSPVMFRDGRWQPTQLASQLPIQLWSRKCSLIEAID